MNVSLWELSGAPPKPLDVMPATRLSNPWAEMSIFQLSIIFGVYARLETLHTHMTFARFAQGLAALYH